MKKTILFLALIFLVNFNNNAQEKINWLSYEEAMDLNEKTPKPMVISIYASWCGWCKKMDKDTFSDSSIINYVNKNMYAVKLNGEAKKSNLENYKIAKTLVPGRMGFPTTIFLKGEEKLKKSGYLNAKRFEQVLNSFTENSYSKFKKKNSK